MRAPQRFLTIMSVFLLVCAVVCLWRVLSADGRDIWYVPLVLVCVSGAMAAGARGIRGKDKQNKD